MSPGQKRKRPTGGGTSRLPADDPVVVPPPPPNTNNNDKHKNNNNSQHGRRRLQRGAKDKAYAERLAAGNNFGGDGTGVVGGVDSVGGDIAAAAGGGQNVNSNKSSSSGSGSNDNSSSITNKSKSTRKKRGRSSKAKGHNGVEVIATPAGWPFTMVPSSSSSTPATSKSSSTNANTNTARSIIKQGKRSSQKSSTSISSHRGNNTPKNAEMKSPKISIDHASKKKATNTYTHTLEKETVASGMILLSPNVTDNPSATKPTNSTENETVKPRNQGRLKNDLLEAQQQVQLENVVGGEATKQSKSNESNASNSVVEGENGNNDENAKPSSSKSPTCRKSPRRKKSPHINNSINSNQSKSSSGWECNQCTLLNSNRRKKCEVCGFLRDVIVDADGSLALDEHHARMSTSSSSSTGANRQSNDTNVGIVGTSSMGGNDTCNDKTASSSVASTSNNTAFNIATSSSLSVHSTNEEVQEDQQQQQHPPFPNESGESQQSHLSAMIDAPVFTRSRRRIDHSTQQTVSQLEDGCEGREEEHQQKSSSSEQLPTALQNDGQQQQRQPSDFKQWIKDRHTTKREKKRQRRRASNASSSVSSGEEIAVTVRLTVAGEYVSCTPEKDYAASQSTLLKALVPLPVLFRIGDPNEYDGSTVDEGNKERAHYLEGHIAGHISDNCVESSQPNAENETDQMEFAASTLFQMHDAPGEQVIQQLLRRSSPKFSPASSLKGDTNPTTPLPNNDINQSSAADFQPENDDVHQLLKSNSVLETNGGSLDDIIKEHEPVMKKTLLARKDIGALALCKASPNKVSDTREPSNDKFHSKVDGSDSNGGIDSSKLMIGSNEHVTETTESKGTTDCTMDEEDRVNNDDAATEDFHDPTMTGAFSPTTGNEPASTGEILKGTVKSVASRDDNNTETKKTDVISTTLGCTNSGLVGKHVRIDDTSSSGYRQINQGSQHTSEEALKDREGSVGAGTNPFKLDTATAKYCDTDLRGSDGDAISSAECNQSVPEDVGRAVGFGGNSNSSSGSNKQQERDKTKAHCNPESGNSMHIEIQQTLPISAENDHTSCYLRSTDDPASVLEGNSSREGTISVDNKQCANGGFDYFTENEAAQTHHEPMARHSQVAGSVDSSYFPMTQQMPNFDYFSQVRFHQ